MAGKYDLVIEQGITYNKTFIRTVYSIPGDETSPRIPVDITGMEARGAIRSRDGVLIATFFCTVNGAAGDHVDGLAEEVDLEVLAAAVAAVLNAKVDKTATNQVLYGRSVPATPGEATFAWSSLAQVNSIARRDANGRLKAETASLQLGTARHRRSRHASSTTEHSNAHCPERAQR